MASTSQSGPAVQRRMTEILLAAVFALAAVATMAQPPLPQHDGARHVGAQTCGSSSCHDAPEPSAFAVVEQNEYRIWIEHDRHARAFESLTSERAVRIAGNLDIGEPTEAAMCLSCHSNYVPADRRGRNFRLSDGVSCEACHGGGEPWLGAHSAGVNTHQDNLHAGMYPTSDPDARARLCLSCHQGTPDKPMTHRLYSAGHPRLALELDTFSMARPAHHVEDADYRQRKPDLGPMRVWALGQVRAAHEWRALHADPEANPAGDWPEWSFYSCYGCHRSVDAATGGQYQNPRFDVSRLQMLEILMSTVDSTLANDINRALADAGNIRSRSEGEALLSGLDAVLEQAVAVTHNHQFNLADARRVVSRLVEAAERGVLDSYGAAEQATYAIGVLVDQAGQENAAYHSPPVEAAVDALYAAARQGATFDRSEWAAAMAELGTAFAAVEP